jgi:hypothetical protein
VKDRLAALEEFARAWLWQENIILNEGLTADPMEDYNTRTMRLREAARDIPQDLRDEVWKEFVALDAVYAAADQSTDGDSCGDGPVSESEVSVVMRPIGTRTGRDDLGGE